MVKTVTINDKKCSEVLRQEWLVDVTKALVKKTQQQNTEEYEHLEQQLVFLTEQRFDGPTEQKSNCNG